MARQTITIVEFVCDLCGEVREEHNLRRLYGPPGNKPGQRPQVDVCDDCVAKPVAAVFSVLDTTEKAARPVRVARGKTRTAN